MNSETKQDDINYDEMSENEYYAEMEKKVEFYKQNYPDMYEKAQQWLKMLEHSEIYNKNTNDDDENKNVNQSELLQAKDILKNMKYQGLCTDELTDTEIELLDKYIIDWKKELQE